MGMHLCVCDENCRSVNNEVWNYLRHSVDLELIEKISCSEVYPPEYDEYVPLKVENIEELEEIFNKDERAMKFLRLMKEGWYFFISY